MRPTLIVIDDKLYKKSSMDSLLSPSINIVPPTPTPSLPDSAVTTEDKDLSKGAKLKVKWRTLSRLLQCVSGFKQADTHIQRSMSDPEIATRMRDNDSIVLSDSDKHTQYSL